MNENKNLLHHVADWWQIHQSTSHSQKRRSRWLPSPGNILFTLLIAGLLILTQRTWAANNQNTNTPGPSATTINYQGRLADDAGNPQTGTLGMSFAIWDAANGGGIIWGPESHSAVPVTDGLFNVGLGSQTSGGIPTTVWNGDRYLEITVGGETLTPRELIRSVPIAGMALTAQTALTANSADIALTVPDGVVTSNKLNLTLAKDHAEVDINTTSATATELQSTSISLDNPGQILVTWQSHVENTAINGGGDFAVYLDGIYQSGLRAVYESDAHVETINITGVIDNVSAGSHTISIYWHARNGGTLTNYERLLNVIYLGQ